MTATQCKEKNQIYENGSIGYAC